MGESFREEPGLFRSGAGETGSGACWHDGCSLSDMTSRRSASWWLLCLLASLTSGCAVEAPYASDAAPPAPSPPLSVRDVLFLVDQRFAEDAILGWVRLDGINSPPTTAQLRKLRRDGASEEWIACFLSADLSLPEIHPEWLPFQLFPGLPPFPCWHWVEGMKRLAPRTVEVLP